MVYSVNRKLLPVKLFYFNFLAGIAVLFPYLPIFLKSLDLNQAESSIIFGTMPFVGFVSRLLLGAVADKYKKHKLVLIVCVIAQTIAFDVMVFVPLAGFKLETSQRSVPCSLNQCPNSSRGDCSLSCKNESSISCGTVNASSSFSCDKNVTCELTCESRISQLDTFSNFFILLILSLVGSIFFNGISSIQDTITYSLLGEKGHAFGRQRLWGTVGYGLFSLTCGLLLHMSESRTETKFFAAFVLHFVFNVLAALCVIPYRVESNVHGSNIMGNMMRVVAKPKVAVFLMVVFVYGADNGVIEAFLFWYLEEDLGASKLLFGVSLGLQCVMEVPAYLCASYVIKKIGHANLFMIVLIAFAVRLTGYSLIGHAWLTLVFDAFNFFTFGLMYTSAVHYGTIIAPPGMEATTQCLIGGVYFGIGRGVGGLVAGVIYEEAGPIVMLRSFALFTLFMCLLFAIYHFLSNKCAKALPVETAVTEKLPVGDEDTVPPAGEEQEMCLMQARL